MKTKILNFLAIVGIASLMLTSCKKNDPKIISNGGKGGTLTVSSTTPVLSKNALSDTSSVVTFKVTQSNWGAPTVTPTNVLQIDSAGDNWKKPISVTLSAGVLTQRFSTATFNAMLLKLHLPAGTASKVEARVISSVSTSVYIYSNSLTLTVTPFNLTSWVYVAGAYEGWANPGPQEDSLVSVTGNGIYTGIINFNATGSGANQFLILPVKGSWTNKYATNDPTTQVPSSTVTYNANNNFNAPAAPGQYIVTLNLNSNTITFQAADYYSITGSAALGWGIDTPLKFINDGTNTWAANNVAMVVGEYKFRQDDQWTNSWGPGATAGTAVSSGATGDGNLQLTTAGNYNFTFVMPATAYGSTPLASTTYTSVKK